MGVFSHDQMTAPLPTPTAGQSGARPIWLRLTTGLGIMLVVIGLVTVGYVAYFAQRVLPGVHVAGLELGGLTEGEATAALTEHLDTFLTSPLSFVVAEQRWAIAPRDLGLSYDVPATVRTALAIGRQGQFGDWLPLWWPLQRSVQSVQPIGRLEQAGLVSGLQPLLQSVNRPAINATVAVKPGVGLTVLPDRAGQMIDIGAATLALQERAGRLSSEPIVLQPLPLPPAIQVRQLDSIKGTADTLLSQPFSLILTNDDSGRVAPTAPRRWSITPADLSQMLLLVGSNSQRLSLDEDHLTAYLSKIEAELARPSRNAELRLDPDGTLTLTPHAEGVALNGPTSIKAINAAIAQGDSQAFLSLRSEQPAVPTAALEPVHREASLLLERTLKVNAADVTRSFGRKELGGILRLEVDPQAADKIAIQADLRGLDRYLEEMARQVNREPRAPAFRFLGGRVQRTVEPVQGRQLDLAGARDLLARSLTEATAREIQLPVKTVDSPLATLNPGDIVIKDLLASGTTYYGFSLPERRHNVELATQRLNGTLIPPGELFSFNRAVGRVNTANGYRTGYGIVLTNGAVQTVPSVGGGICQVATTVFHAAFRSGLPIGERNWHFYWIPTYGQAPSGLTGLDATVDEDYGLDFTFRNTTGNWLAVETSFDGANMSIALRGTSPGWEVKVAGPTISNVKTADPKPVERVDASLAPGRRVQVETARDGMDVSITRTVVRGGQVVDQRTFNSHYEPSQNVTLVGPRPEEPKKAEEPAAKPNETPAAVTPGANPAQPAATPVPTAKPTDPKPTDPKPTATPAPAKPPPATPPAKPAEPTRKPGDQRKP